MKPDTWHVTHGGGWIVSQIVSSLAFTVWVVWYYKGFEEKGQSINQLINYKDICRTAPSTPNILIRALFYALGKH